MANHTKVKFWSLTATIMTALFAMIAVASGGAVPPVPVNAERAQQTSSSIIYFEKASGNQHIPIRYSARTASYDIFIAREEADVVLHSGLQPSGEVARGKVTVVQVQANVIRMRFVDANLPTSVGPLQNSPARHLYDTVAYRGIYPGLDVLLHCDDRGIEFQLNISPGFSSAPVLELDGATSIELNQHGNAIVHAGREQIVLQRPMIRAVADQNAPLFSGAYQIEGSNRLRFITGLPATHRVIRD